MTTPTTPLPIVARALACNNAVPLNTPSTLNPSIPPGVFRVPAPYLGSATFILQIIPNLPSGCNFEIWLDEIFDHNQMPLPLVPIAKHPTPPLPRFPIPNINSITPVRVPYLPRPSGLKVEVYYEVWAVIFDILGNIIAITPSIYIIFYPS